MSDLPASAPSSLHAVLGQAREAAKSLARDREVRTRRSRVRVLLTELLAEQAVLEERAKRESTDADRIESWSLEWLTALATGTVDETQNRERDEAVRAGLEALAHAHALAVVEAEEQALSSLRDTHADHRFWTLCQSLTRLGRSALVSALEDEVAARVACQEAEALLALADDAIEALDAHASAETAPERGALRGRVVMAVHAAGLIIEAPDASVLGPVRKDALSRLGSAQAELRAAVERTDAVSSDPPHDDDPAFDSALDALRRAYTARVELLEVRETLAQSEDRVEALEKSERAERQEVSDLEQAGLSRWWTWMSGTLPTELRREREELEVAVRQLARARREQDRLQVLEVELRDRLGALGSVEERFVDAAFREHGEHRADIAETAAASEEFGELVENVLVLEELMDGLRSMRLPDFGWFQQAPSLISAIERVHAAVRQHNTLLEAYDVAFGPLSVTALDSCVVHLNRYIDARRNTRGKKARKRAMAPHRQAFRDARDRYQSEYAHYVARFEVHREAMKTRRKALQVRLGRRLAALASEL